MSTDDRELEIPPFLRMVGEINAAYGQQVGKPTDAMNAPPKAKTYDDGKPPLSRLPWAAIYAMARVQAYGGKKYGDFDNYRTGMEITRNLSCSLRHIAECLEGVDTDHESGEHVLAHAMCRIAFVLQNIADGTIIDDRYSRRPK